MGLEDMPEMQVLDEDYNPINVNRTFLDSFFIVIKGPNSKNYIFSQEGVHAHPTLYEVVFRGVLKYKYNVDDKNYPSDFKALNGGHLRIKDGQLTLYGKSEQYGKYEEQAVSPIIEKWTKENFPTHNIIFK